MALYKVVFYFKVLNWFFLSLVTVTSSLGFVKILGGRRKMRLKQKTMYES